MFNVCKSLTLTVLIFLSLLSFSCKDQVSDEIVAKVGSREITLKQVDRAIKQQLDTSGSSAPLSPAELVAARLNVLQNLVQQEAMFIKAQKENMVPDDNKVNQEIQKQKQDASLTEEQYQTRIKEAGLTEQDLRDELRKQLAINALSDREKARVKAPSEDEIRRYYDEHKAEFVANRGADISLIATDPANNGATDDAIGDAAAEQKIKEIYAELKAGRDFATVAARRSEDPSALRSGNLGFAAEPNLKQSFASKPEVAQRLMEQMSPGEYTEPIREGTSGRWFIFKLNNKREKAQDLGLEDVRTTIIEGLTQQRQQLLLTAIQMVAVAETTVKNFFAERIVEKPDTVVMMQPSALLQNRPAPEPQPQQQPPRIEDQNANSNRAAPSKQN